MNANLKKTRKLFHFLFSFFISLSITSTIYFSTLTIVSCSQNYFSNNILITIYLPKWDNSLPELDSWVLELTSQDFHKKVILESTVNNYSLEINKDSYLSVLAYPITKDYSNNYVQFFYPAGAIYPHTDLESIKLEWQTGFCSTLLKTLYLGKSDIYSNEQTLNFIKTFNWQRLMNKINTYCNEENNQQLYNPWILNRSEITKNIANKSFSEKLLKPKDFIQIETKQFKNHFFPYVPCNLIQDKDFITFNNLEVIFIEDLDYNFYKMSINSQNNILLEKTFLPIFNKEL